MLVEIDKEALRMQRAKELEQRELDATERIMGLMAKPKVVDTKTVEQQKQESADMIGMFAKVNTVDGVPEKSSQNSVEMEATKNFMQTMRIDVEAKPADKEQLTAEQQAKDSKDMIDMFKAVNEPEQTDKQPTATESFSEDDIETLKWAKGLFK